MAKSKQKTKADKPGKTAADKAAAPQTAPADLRVVQVVEADLAKPDLRKRELMERVIERSEIKKRDAKPVIEAMLAVLGETLAEGRGLNLEPLGKLRVNRTVEKVGHRIVVSRLRQKLDAGAAGRGADAQKGRETDFAADDADSDGAPD